PAPPRAPCNPRRRLRRRPPRRRRAAPPQGRAAPPPATRAERLAPPQHLSVAERAFWNPMANMGAIRERAVLTIVRGEGSTVWDDEGNAYLDAIASLWYCNVGHVA